MHDYLAAVGNVAITSLSDGRLQFPPGDFFPSVPEEAWEPHRDQFAPDGKIVLNIGSFLLRSDGKAILVDTGLGQSSRGLEEAVSGLLQKDMKSKGVRLDEVDMVVMTHLHRDHVGWNLVWDGDVCRPTFPNARYWAPKADWDLFTRRAGMDMFSYIGDQVLPLERLGVLEIFEGEQALTSELTVLPTPGHTPGHTSVLISSQGERGVILGDLAHIPVQVQETDWSPRADTNPDLSRVTRREMMERMEIDGSLVVSGHFRAPGYGRLIRLEGRRYWRGL